MDEVANPVPNETAARKQRREVAEALIGLVREALAKGEPPPWRKPWVGGLGTHRTGRKGKQTPYKRWNAWSTFVTASRNGVRSERWFTDAQGLRLGWTLPPGSPSASIIVPMPGRSGGGGGLWGVDWGHASVYNRDSFIGPEPEPPPKPWDGVKGVARVVTLLKGVGLDLGMDGRAYFNPAEDRIGIPPAHFFDSPEGWAGTALHEVIHWTGHACRLNRLKIPWTPDEYAFEELVAELGCCMVASRLGLPAARVDDDDHMAYLAIWAKRIEHDPTALITAMEQADAAAAFLEAIVPDAFKSTLGDEATAAVADTPRVLREGGIWRADAREQMSVRSVKNALPAFAMGPTSALAVLGWMKACERWADDDSATSAPALIVAGLPGDGAETVLEWVAAAMSGETEGRQLPVEYADTRQVEFPLPAARRFEPRWLGTDLGDPNRLPAVALVRRGGNVQAVLTQDALPVDPKEFVTSLCDPDVLASPTVRVVRYRGVPEPEATYGVFVARVYDEPLAGRLAAARLAKADPRRWLAAAHRQRASTRRIESWSGRLRATAPWLDGQRHAVRDPLERIRFCDSAPFAPVVLQAAQAVLDAVARHRRTGRSLASLVELALQRFAEHDVARLIPLDVLMAPMFGFAAPHDDRSPDLGLRARSVVQMLTLCPELSRGTTTLAVLLLLSLDEDFDAFRTAVEAACGTGRPGRTGRSGRSNSGRLERRNHSWKCDLPLKIDGDSIRETDR